LAGVLAGVELVGGFPHHQPRGFDLDAHVGQHEGDALAVGDRLAKGNAILGIVDRVFVGSPRLPTASAASVMRLSVSSFWMRMPFSPPRRLALGTATFSNSTSNISSACMRPSA
jgi:hypothetical protein